MRRCTRPCDVWRVTMEGNGMGRAQELACEKQQHQTHRRHSHDIIVITDHRGACLSKCGRRGVRDSMQRKLEQRWTVRGVARDG